MCGENESARRWIQPAAGSSPRVRGKPKNPGALATPSRLIPACAGKTGRTLQPVSEKRAHPRVCGENAIARAAGPGFEGSSPRVRGKQMHDRFGCVFGGLIPACAGKTVQELVCDALEWAHPRVCGENLFASFIVLAVLGSSPRVRGKPISLHPSFLGSGLIPACAGKTTLVRRCCMSARAHPRVCGENTKWCCLRLSIAGSSPRVRGKPRGSRLIRIGERLIPACAGKTRRARRRDASTQAHPRVCGENRFAGNPGRHHAGSSPRVRGKLDRPSDYRA